MTGLTILSNRVRGDCRMAWVRTTTRRLPCSPCRICRRWAGRLKLWRLKRRLPATADRF